MQRLFTYNIQTKVGSNLNRYTYVLNNPLKYTDPSGYAYYGYGGANTSAGVMQNRCLISQQIEDFETRRSAFLSNQWHDVTLFDMIGDRGGAVSGNSGNSNIPTNIEWHNRVYDDAENNTVYHLYKVVNRVIEYISSSLGNISLEELNYWWKGVAQGNGGYHSNDTGFEGFNQENVDFAGAVGGGLTTVFGTAAHYSDLVKAARNIGIVGNVISGVAYGNALYTHQAQPSHHLDAAITAGLIGHPVTAPFGITAGFIYGGARLIGGEAFDQWFNTQFTPSPVLSPNKIKP